MSESTMPNKIYVVIYGTRSRDFLINPLLKSLNLSSDHVVYDDRPNGGLPLYTIEKAFRYGKEHDCTHVLAVPDDMIFSNNWEEIAYRMVNAHPNDVFSLFTYSFERWNVESAFDAESPYTYANGLCGNGIIMPVNIIEDCFDWIHDKTLNEFDKTREEYIIFKYLLSHKIKVITPVQSIVQHIGDNYGTLLSGVYGTPSHPRVSNWFFYTTDNSLDWDSTKIIPYPNFKYRPTDMPDMITSEFLVNNDVIQEGAVNE